jgi:hypothetical protein
MVYDFTDNLSDILSFLVHQYQEFIPSLMVEQGCGVFTNRVFQLIENFQNLLKKCFDWQELLLFKHLSFPGI